MLATQSKVQVRVTGGTALPTAPPANAPSSLPRLSLD